MFETTVAAVDALRDSLVRRCDLLEIGLIRAQSSADTILSELKEFRQEFNDAFSRLDEALGDR